MILGEGLGELLFKEIVPVYGILVCYSVVHGSMNMVYEFMLTLVL